MGKYIETIFPPSAFKKIDQRNNWEKASYIIFKKCIGSQFSHYEHFQNCALLETL